MSLNAIATNAENEARLAASLRRIAIVLRDLPESVALKLLDEIGPEARRRVQREVRMLVDVDPMERKRALESFAGSIKRHAARQLDHRVPPGRSSDLPTNDSVVNNHPTDDNVHRSDQSPTEPQPGRPLEFLDRVDDDDLLSLLEDEHPQTKAVVFASIEPSRAARILPRLGNAQRQDMLSRIGRLQSLPEEMLADLAGSFQSRVQRMQSSRNRNPLQRLIDQNAIDHPGEHAVWNPGEVAKHIPKAAVAASPRLQAILAELPSAASKPAPKTPSRNEDVASLHAPPESMDEEASHVAERLRQITRQSEVANHSPSTDQTATNQTDLSTDEIHQQLIKLPARRLCEALARVETRVAILALCGLPNKTADAAIACLPRTAANQVRQQFMSLGSMEIREIDRAKEQVAQAARIGDISQHSTRLAA